MTEVGFYHLTRSTLEEALPRLLEKAYAAGNRVLVRGSDAERLELLNRSLVDLRQGHRSCRTAPRSDGFAEQQPIYLTIEIENPNGATILVLVDGAEAPDLADFARCLDLFDGGDPDAVDARPRALARGGRSRATAAVYWQQSERGGWTKAPSGRPAEADRATHLSRLASPPL